MPIRVLIVDDHTMFREGLRAILQHDAGVSVVGECCNGREAVEMAGKTQPDVVLIDIGMSELNGVDATRQIHADHPEIKLVAVSAHADRRFVFAMLDAGGSGYVLKEAAGEELLRAVKAVHCGKKFLSPEIVGAVIDGFVRGRPVPAASGARPELGAREREVVQLLAEGKSSKDVAIKLHISLQTVETHRRNIMGKLNIHSLSLLTKYAIREGLTTAEG